MIVRLTLAHSDTPLSFKASFCVIDISAHRFLLGRDLLVPLKFEASAMGLRLTDPKTSVPIFFPYANAPVNMCITGSPFLGASFADLGVPPVLKGDNKAPIFATFLAASASKGDIFSPFCNVLPTKGDFSFTFPAASATKGDDSVNCCVVDVDFVPFSHKSSLSSPVSHTSVQYLGESLTEILQLEQLLVDSCPISCFSEWGLSSDVHNIPPHIISNTLGDISNISNVVGAEVHVFPDADLEFSAPAVVICCASNVAEQL